MGPGQISNPRYNNSTADQGLRSEVSHRADRGVQCCLGLIRSVWLRDNPLHLHRQFSVQILLDSPVLRIPAEPDHRRTGGPSPLVPAPYLRPHQGGAGHPSIPSPNSVPDLLPFLRPHQGIQPRCLPARLRPILIAWGIRLGHRWSRPRLHVPAHSHRLHTGIYDRVAQHRHLLQESGGSQGPRTQ